MFTGLVEQQAKIKSLTYSESQDSLRICYEVCGDFPETGDGDSIALNGCCLTVVEQQGQELSFDVSKETLELTNFRALKVGDQVNLEWAMQLHQRLGGHLVSGHVDGTGSLLKFETHADGSLLQVQVPKSLSRYMIKKGSICLDGISLTINELKDDAESSVIALMIIPATIAKTHLGTLSAQHQFNVEVDMMAKFAERLHTVQVEWSN